MTISTHNSEYSQIGVVGVPDSDEKEISLILGIYQLDKTPIAILISVGRRLWHWLMGSLSALSGRIYTSLKFPGHTKDFKNCTYCHSVQHQTARVKVGGNALALKKAQLIPCTVVLYDKGGTNHACTYWSKCVGDEILLNFGNCFCTFQGGFWKFYSGIMFHH